jgi:hypothetical protein
MCPAALGFRSGNGWMIVHVCVRCGRTLRTMAALQDPRQPDDAVSVAHLSGLT